MEILGPVPVAGRILGDSACARSHAGGFGCLAPAPSITRRPGHAAGGCVWQAARASLLVPLSALRLQGGQLPESTPPVPVCHASGLGVEGSGPRGAAVGCLRVIWTLRDNVHSKLQRGGLHQTSRQHRDRNSSASALHVDSGAMSHSWILFRGASGYKTLGLVLPLPAASGWST